MGVNLGLPLEYNHNGQWRPATLIKLYEHPDFGQQIALLVEAEERGRHYVCSTNVESKYLRNKPQTRSVFLYTLRSPDGHVFHMADCTYLTDAGPTWVAIMARKPVEITDGEGL